MICSVWVSRVSRLSLHLFKLLLFVRTEFIFRFGWARIPGRGGITGIFEFLSCLESPCNPSHPTWQSLVWSVSLSYLQRRGYSRYSFSFLVNLRLFALVLCGARAITHTHFGLLQSSVARSLFSTIDLERLGFVFNIPWICLSLHSPLKSAAFSSTHTHTHHPHRLVLLASSYLQWLSSLLFSSLTRQPSHCQFFTSHFNNNRRVPIETIARQLQVCRQE